LVSRLPAFAERTGNIHFVKLLGAGWSVKSRCRGGEGLTEVGSPSSLTVVVGGTLSVFIADHLPDFSDWGPAESWEKEGNGWVSLWGGWEGLGPLLSSQLTLVFLALECSSQAPFTSVYHAFESLFPSGNSASAAEMGGVGKNGGRQGWALEVVGAAPSLFPSQPPPQPGGCLFLLSTFKLGKWRELEKPQPSRGYCPLSPAPALGGLPFFSPFLPPVGWAGGMALHPLSLGQDILPVS
jgi:hypothetical protein